MNSFLSIVLAVSLLLYPFATYAADYGSQTSQNQQVPPVAQPLVREGDFAIKLAAQLNLGSPSDEATAEDMLTRVGVFPDNGWISDYPVTPEIIGQLNDSIARAAGTGKLPMGSDEAKKELTKLAGQMDLPMPAGPGREATPGQPSLSSQTGPTINNYYYDQGPPVITYYPPPAYYAYLYDWVPYPAVWFGFWFPGFFICHNFTTVVVSPFHGPHHFHRAIVTDHFFDHATGRIAHVDHDFRTDRGVIRPHTVLRSGDGRTFGNVTEFRHANRWNRQTTPQVTPSAPRGNANQPGSGTMRNRMFAQNDIARQNSHNSAPQVPQGSLHGPQLNSAPGTARGFNRAPSAGIRPEFPAAQQRAFNAPTNSGRVGVPPSSSIGRPNAASGMQQRSFAPSMNAGRPNIGPRASAPVSPGSGRSFSGGGWQGGRAGGFAHGGGHAGGRR